jgi:hypothetical protein
MLRTTAPVVVRSYLQEIFLFSPSRVYFWQTCRDGVLLRDLTFDAAPRASNVYTKWRGAVVDRLKSAAEHLEAPGCPNCRIEMRWFSSKLVADEPESVIEHEFICPNCERLGRSRTKFMPARVLPDKLSAPFVTAGLMSRPAPGLLPAA